MTGRRRRQSSWAPSDAEIASCAKSSRKSVSSTAWTATQASRAVRSWHRTKLRLTGGDYRNEIFRPNILASTWPMRCTSSRFSYRWWDILPYAHCLLQWWCSSPNEIVKHDLEKKLWYILLYFGVQFVISSNFNSEWTRWTGKANCFHVPKPTKVKRIIFVRIVKYSCLFLFCMPKAIKVETENAVWVSLGWYLPCSDVLFNKNVLVHSQIHHWHITYF